MKKMFLLPLVVALLLLSPGYYYADEVAETVVETVVEATEDVVVATEDVVVGGTESDEAELMNPLVGIGWEVLAIIIGIISGLIIYAVQLGKKRIEKRLGFELPTAIKELTEGYLTKAINRTEEWAKSQSEKPSSESKMAETLKHALSLAKDSEYVKSFIDENGKNLVEKLLKSEDTPSSASPH